MQLTLTLTKATKKTPQQLNVKMTGTKDEHNEMAQFQDNFQDSDIRNGFLYMLNQLKEEGFDITTAKFSISKKSP